MYSTSMNSYSIRKVAVITTTRAEYGQLCPLLREIEGSKRLRLQLIVSGAHLSPEYGLTYKQIEDDGIQITEKVEMLLSSDTVEGVAKSIGLGVIGFAQAFSRLRPDILLILGDRYEVFAAATAAMAMTIPIVHISGGEVTQGVIDQQIRDALTKMSHIHFPGNDTYAERIMKLSESKSRIISAGDLAIEALRSIPQLDKTDVSKQIGLDIEKKTLVVVYHPVTLELELLCQQMDNLLFALEKRTENIVFTYPGADAGGRYIVQRIEQFICGRSNCKGYSNLGSLYYINLLRYSSALVGNSSSGIVEAPFLKLPVVNIGNRQKGRLKAENIISVPCDTEEITKAIDIAISDSFRETAKRARSLYGDGKTSKIITSTLETIELGPLLMIKEPSANVDEDIAMVTLEHLE